MHLRFPCVAERITVLKPCHGRLLISVTNSASTLSQATRLLHVRKKRKKKKSAVPLTRASNHYLTHVFLILAKMGLRRCQKGDYGGGGMFVRGSWTGRGRETEAEVVHYLPRPSSLFSALIALLRSFPDRSNGRAFRRARNIMRKNKRLEV